MNGSIRNNLILFLILSLALVSCNLPAADAPTPEESARKVIWDLSVSPETVRQEQDVNSLPRILPTSTPQLYKPIDFDSAFKAAEPLPTAAEVPAIQQVYQAASETGTLSQPAAAETVHAAVQGSDAAEWLYFEPAEYSSQQSDTLYAGFRNSGEREWDEQYYLEFYAGKDPTGGKDIHLDRRVAPDGKAEFRIPIQSTDPSWKACWYLKNGGGAILYEFCYNHGTGENRQTEKSAQNSSSDSGSTSSDIFWGFVKKNGKAPAKVSTDELSAKFVSSNPADGHTFKAYDHVEDFSVSFKNNGTAVWDSSYSLKFYSGYNWFHTESVSLQQTVGKGETATFSMPIEIIEDNDKWVTCWYLATPDGQNLSDFCFNYYTRS